MALILPSLRRAVTLRSVLSVRFRRASGSPGPVQALSIVEAFHVGEQGAPGLLVGGVGPVVDQLRFQGVEEAFQGSVAECVPPVGSWTA